ncbi:MAG: hypothetical protein OXF41_22230 [bacterium]|nr:hypothetical protein [bacterium]
MKYIAPLPGNPRPIPRDFQTAAPARSREDIGPLTRSPNKPWAYAIADLDDRRSGVEDHAEVEPREPPPIVGVHPVTQPLRMTGVTTGDGTRRLDLDCDQAAVTAVLRQQAIPYFAWSR